MQGDNNRNIRVNKKIKNVSKENKKANKKNKNVSKEK